MIGKKKVIGVCMTLVFNTYHAELIDHIRKEAADYGCKVMVFNSVVDFCNDDAYDAGANYIYENIDFDLIDALLVFADNFHVLRFLDEIVERGRRAGVPVVVTDQEYDGCYCFTMDYSQAFKELMNHVIRDHGVTRTFFMAGREEEDDESVKRIGLYKEVLAENGLPFSEDMVDYGGYWRNPAMAVIDRLQARDQAMPEAIFCSNDYMAIAAVERLLQLGYRVPEDVKVTGFDGVTDIEFFNPRISTCKEDTEKLIREMVKAAAHAMEGQQVAHHQYRNYKPMLGRSCGCTKTRESSIDFGRLYYLNHSMEDHEAFMQNWVDKLMECTSYSQMSILISKFLLPDSHVCLLEDFVKTLTEPDEFLSRKRKEKAKKQAQVQAAKDAAQAGTGSVEKTEPENKSALAVSGKSVKLETQSLQAESGKTVGPEMQPSETVIRAVPSEKVFDKEKKMYLIWPQDQMTESSEKSIRLKDVVPGFPAWEEDDAIYILTSLFVAEIPCGYLAVRVPDEIKDTGHKINRIARTINIGFNALVDHIKQRRMRESIEHAAYTNMVTGLPNLRGAEKWFEGFSKREDVHQQPFIVTVYAMAQYKYIYETYGIAEAEEVSGFVAQSLKYANKSLSYVAQISGNEFLVVTFGKDQEVVDAVFGSSLEEFERSIRYYNTTSGKPYELEILHGYTNVDPGWTGSLASFSKMANSEVYMNRLKKSAKLHREKIESKDNYDVLNALIEKNLFRYFFQPIVSAKSGEIYAYEALMRTADGIGLNPLEVLQAAEDFDRLYDIEKATMFNVMQRYAEEQQKFGAARIFINHIPGYGLKEKDYQSLCDAYSQHMSNFVFEITEQDTITDSELGTLKNMGGQKSRIAVDDYGTGHSNIVNLLRYAPHIIKIDRFLITDIDQDVNKQMFVKSTVEFAAMNQIKTLAEGVETAAELKTVIGFGVDYIQGYYTGKPAFEPIGRIDERIRQEIVLSAQECENQAG